MKIIIAGGYDTQNLGDYASFFGLYKTLSTKQRIIDTTVLSRHPDDLFGKQFDTKVILNIDHASKEKSFGRVFNGLNEGDSTSHLQSILTEIKKSDLLIFGNGRLFIDICLDHMKGPLSYFEILTVLARFCGTPIALSSVTLVHPKTTQGEKKLSFILRNADKILVREQSSADVACHYIDNSNKIHVAPDIAFALTPEDATSETLPFNIAQNTIGINFRGIDYACTLGDKKISKMAKKVSYILDKYHCDVVFIPQCTYDVDSTFTDDRYVNQRVFDQLSGAEQQRCHVIHDKLTLKQTLKLYKDINYLFTSRRHGFILSLTQGTQATLICNEANTAVVKESVPVKELYISEEDRLEIPGDYMQQVNLHLERLRADTQIYSKVLFQGT